MGQKINPIGLRLESIEVGTQHGLLRKRFWKIFNRRFQNKKLYKKI